MFSGRVGIREDISSLNMEYANVYNLVTLGMYIIFGVVRAQHLKKEICLKKIVAATRLILLIHLKT